VILEGIGSADVPDDGSGIAMPALINDAREICAPLGGCRDVAGSQGVCPEGRGTKGRLLSLRRDKGLNALRKLRHSLVAQPLGAACF